MSAKQYTLEIKAHLPYASANTMIKEILHRFAKGISVEDLATEFDTGVEDIQEIIRIAILEYQKGAKGK